MSTYLTDSWSTVTGLASVAYGSPDRYPEVANQVRSGSVVSFLGNIAPGDVLRPYMSEDQILSALQKEYGRGGEFAEYVDSGHKTLQEISSEFLSNLLQSAGEAGSYETSLGSLISYSNPSIPINNVKVAEDLLNQISDLDTYTLLSTSVPYTKLDKLPSGDRIDLKDSVSLDLDYNNIGFSTGYLTPKDYFNNMAYPGMVGEELPNNIITTLTEGYVGYPTLQPLDDVFRPGLSSVLSISDIQDVRGVSRSIAGLGTLNTIQDLTAIGKMSQADQAMYSVDLAEIVIERNGYTVFDPNNSNGDLVDPVLLPNYDQKNSDSGLTYSARSRSSAL